MLNEKINQTDFIKWVCSEKTQLNRGVDFRYSLNGYITYQNAGMRCPQRFTEVEFLDHFADDVYQWQAEYAIAHDIELQEAVTVEINDAQTEIIVTNEQGEATISTYDFFNWLCSYNNESQDGLAFWSVDHDNALVVRTSNSVEYDAERCETYTVPHQASVQSFKDFIYSNLGRCYLLDRYLDCAEVEFVKDEEETYFREDFVFAA